MDASEAAGQVRQANATRTDIRFFIDHPLGMKRKAEKGKRNYPAAASLFHITAALSP
jgi:hypothetical protein